MKNRLNSYLGFDLIRSTAMVSILIFLVSSVGIPLPALVKKDRSVPFPCMDRACGCRSAAECKKHCCCFSNAEKSAWARRRGLDPATVATVEPAREDRANVSDVTSAEVSSCQSDCCAKADKPIARPACPHCRQSKTAPSIPQAKSSEETSQGTVDVIIASFERKCQGGDHFWLILASAMTPPAQIQLTIVEQLLATLTLPDFISLCPSANPPPTPPPEWA